MFPFLPYGLQVGRVIVDDGVKWMLLAEIQNDCHLAIKADDPHPRLVYFVHVTEDDAAAVEAEGGEK